ncbi:MAG: pyrroline-5-carboxylate reductase [Verrucomicrobia bacterium]|nr:pyrroline-5-carboxylate reductase [Verrucomicrobiota bacterium]
MSKIAFLGAGNLASAMVDGLLAQGRAPADLVCYSASGRTAAALAARTGIAQAQSLDNLLAGADLLVVAFKPQHLAGADPRLAALSAGRLVVSVLAGKRLATLAKVFPSARNIVRAMPNTPAAIGAAITPYCSLQPLTPADRAAVEALAGAFGQHLPIGEEHMNAVTAVSGSGPAFLFEFVAALRDGGVAAGLPPEVAARLATETALGAARLLARRGVDPEVLRNQVTSPNGTTLAGLKKMEAGNFRGVLRETVLAAQARAVELSQDA